MKKQLLFASLAFAFTAKAQITLVEWDVAPVGTQLVQDQDTIPNVQPGSSGANAVWNFINVVPHTTSNISVTNPNWTPYSSEMQGSNLAFDLGQQTYFYLNNTSNGLFAIGQAGDFGLGPMAIRLDDQEQLLKFPMTYNTSFNDTSLVDFTTFFGQQGIDSVRIVQYKTKTVNVDGWGNITTPLGTFTCLRQKNYSITTTDIYGYVMFVGWQPLQSQVDTNYQFEWWTQNKGYAVMSMDSAVDGTISNVNWLSANPAPNAVEENNAAVSIGVYPNPANSVISFDVTNVNAEQLSITDITGRAVQTINVQQNLINMNVTDFAAGTYIYTVRDANGAIVTSGKFNVTK
jgi:hypothetical protein